MRSFLWLICSVISFKTAYCQHLNSPQQTPPNFLSLKGATTSQTTLKQALLSTQLNLSAGEVVSECSTATFYMHVPAEPNQKIEVRELQTLPNGDFLITGNRTLNNNEEEGLVLRMSASGAIIYQKSLRVATKPTTLFSAKASALGGIVISGRINDGSNSVFVARLNDDLTTNWNTITAFPVTPLKVVTDLYDNDKILLAVQFPSKLVYSMLKANGVALWTQEVTIDGLTDLIGFSTMNYDAGLITNCVRNNKRVTQITSIATTDGKILTSHTMDNGSTENQASKATAFNQRLNLVSIVKTGSTFELARNIMYASENVETKHTYKLVNSLDFTSSAALDNAADALGVSFPAQGKLVFIKYFA